MKSLTLTEVRPQLPLAVAMLFIFSCCLSAFADFSTTVLSKSPKGYWQFNETNPVPQMTAATNYGSASSANGVYFNGAATEATPIAGNPGQTAVHFDGLTQRIQVPYNAALNPASAFSVEAWVRPSTTPNVDSFWFRSVVRSGGPSWGGGYMLMYNANAGSDAQLFKFTLYNSSGGFEVYNTNFVGNGNFNIFAVDGAWYHMVGTWSSSDNKGHLYVNGVELTNLNVLSSNGVAYTPTTNGFLRIAGADTDPTQTLPSNMDPGGVAHVAVYNTQLTQSQIIAHYQAGTNGASNYSATVLADSPVGYYQLNETNFPALPVAINQGVAGAALNGTYCVGTTPGVTASTPPNYTGFTSNNTGVYLTNGISTAEPGGLVLFPALRNPTDGTNLTIVALIKNNGPQMSAASILGRRVPGQEKSAFQFDSAGSGLGYNWDDTGSQFNYSSGFQPLDGVLTFAAVVISPTNAVVYMDSGNGLQASTNAVSNLTSNGFVRPVYLGAEGGNFANSGRRYNGMVDELAVWTNSLTQQDMLDLREAWIGSGLSIAKQPAGRPVMLGGLAKFNCTPVGSTNYMPFTFQLKKDGLPVGSPSSSSTVLYSNVQAADLASSFTINVLTNGVPSSLTSGGAGLTRWTIPGTYSALVESMSPTVYYRFREASGTTVYDIANCKDGFLSGPVSVATGPQAIDAQADVGFETNNQGYFFAGTSSTSGVNLGVNNSGITNVPGQLATTITCWLKPNGSQPAFSGIYYSRASDFASLTYGPSGGQELGTSWTPGNFNTHTFVFTINNQWNFVAMVVTNTSATFYSYNTQNGWQSNTITGTFNVPNTSGGTGTWIGNDPNTGLNRPVKGWIDEVAVFHKAMSWPEIQSLANAGTRVNLAIQPLPGNNCEIDWSYGALQAADLVGGPYTNVPGASAMSFTTNSAGAQKYFRAAY